MFTGIVEEMGRVVRLSGGQLVIEAAKVLDSTALGDSISVNGCCLTVVEVGPGWWAADVVAETLSRTSIGSLESGDPVDLERPCRADGRLDGHIVQGHVDAVGMVVRTDPLFTVSIPARLSRYVAEKGSIALDGVSLTVVAVTETDGPLHEVSVALIPHTAEVTVLGLRRPGDRVNVEVDLLAKYVERLLNAAGTDERS